MAHGARLRGALAVRGGHLGVSRLLLGVRGGGLRLEEDAPSFARWALVSAARGVGYLLASTSIVVLVFYVLGNGPNDGALALATLPVLVFAGLYRSFDLGHRRQLAFLVSALLIADAGYAAWRITCVVADPDLALCVDGVCGAEAPWLARLVREDETAFAGMALSGALGMLSDEERPDAESSTRRAYAELATRRGGRAGFNGVLLSSTATHVTTLVSMPPGDAPVPGLVFLHGFGGLITPSLTALSDSELGRRYAIVAPALDMAGYWWEPPGREVLARTLATLPPRVDRDRLWLVGLSNGAVGANVFAADPELGPAFRGTILLVGAGQRPGDPMPTGPVLLIPGLTDERFPLSYLRQAADLLEAGGVEVTWEPVDGDHFIQFTHRDEVVRRISSWLDAHELPPQSPTTTAAGTAPSP